jgi:hypothetical protein
MRRAGRRAFYVMEMMFELREIPYPSEGIRFSARILDIEHHSN